MLNVVWANKEQHLDDCIWLQTIKNHSLMWSTYRDKAEAAILKMDKPKRKS